MTSLYLHANRNLAIGSVVPQEKLHVSGNLLTENFIDANMQVRAGIGNSSSLKLFESGNFGYEFEYDGTPDKLYLHSRGFTGNEGIRMTWLKDGNVGIGTTSPLEPLHVAGNILSTGILRVRDGSQDISLVTNASEGYVKLDVGGNGHSADHIILGETGSGSLNKVGIGTTNPGGVISNALLEVSGGHIALKNNFGIFSNNSTGTGIGAGFDTDSDDDLFLFAGGGNRMTVAANGNVGIGTSAPEFPLHIQEPGTSGQTIAMVIESATSKRPVILFSEVGSNHTLANGMSLEYDGSGGGSNGNKFRINKAGGNPALTVENGGEVGINVVSPAATLHLIQTMNNSRGIRIEHPTNTKYWDLGMSAFDLNFHYDGDFKASINDTDGSYLSISDVRLKQDITRLAPVLQRVKQLQPSRYRYKTHPEANKSIGFIAQEVEAIFPEIVKEVSGTKMINYDAFSVIAIQAIKELVAEKDQLEVLVQDQQYLIDQNGAELQALRKELQEMKRFIRDQASSKLHNTQK